MTGLELMHDGDVLFTFPMRSELLELVCLLAARCNETPERWVQGSVHDLLSQRHRTEAQRGRVAYRDCYPGMGIGDAGPLPDDDDEDADDPQADGDGMPG